MTVSANFHTFPPLPLQLEFIFIHNVVLLKQHISAVCVSPARVEQIKFRSFLNRALPCRVTGPERSQQDPPAPLTQAPKLSSYGKAAWVGAFGWHTPKTTVIGRERRQISIRDSSASYQSWFPSDSTLVSSEVATSRGRPTVMTRIHIHLVLVNISPGNLWFCARLPRLPVGQLEGSQLLRASVGMRAGKGFANGAHEGWCSPAVLWAPPTSRPAGVAELSFHAPPAPPPRRGPGETIEC